MPFNFIKNNQKPWPPENMKPMQSKMREWAAWYSGDPVKLLHVYSERLSMPYTAKGRFWQKAERQERIEKIHVPIASDIASVSADLLFSEPPEVKINEAHEENTDSTAKETQDRISEIINHNQTYSTFVEAAETASALGGSYFKINWNKDFKDFPILSVAQADAAVPEFQWGFLKSVTFFKIIERDGSKVFRKLEKHEPGVIINELYQGTESRLGRKMQLSYLDETSDLKPEIQTGIDDILVRYIPNKLPNKLWRSHYLGNSDYQGLEGLFDSLDEAYSAWIRELRLAKAEKVVPESWLELNTNTGNFQYDMDKSTYTSMNMPADEMEKPEVVQPKMRVEQYELTCLNLIERIISSAGYSPQSFGLNIDGRAESGTALRVRERKSLKTKTKKERYFREPLQDILQLMLKVDYEHFGNTSIDPELKPSVTFADSIQDDPSEIAESLSKLEQAKAMSIESKVRYLHQDWSEQEVEDEVERIKEEQGMLVETPEVGG